MEHNLLVDYCPLPKPQAGIELKDQRKPVKLAVKRIVHSKLCGTANYHIEMACATRKESADKGQRLLDEDRVLSDQLPAERRATAIHPGLETGRINYVQSEN